jgi:hypothetical protein
MSLTASKSYPTNCYQAQLNWQFDCYLQKEQHMLDLYPLLNRNNIVIIAVQLWGNSSVVHTKFS